MKIGQKIKELRVQNNLTLVQFAEKVNVSASAIHKIEKNLVKGLSDQMKYNIIKAFNLPHDYFLINSSEIVLEAENTTEAKGRVANPNNRKEVISEAIYEMLYDLRRIIKDDESINTMAFIDNKIFDVRIDVHSINVYDKEDQIKEYNRIMQEIKNKPKK